MGPTNKKIYIADKEIYKNTSIFPNARIMQFSEKITGLRQIVMSFFSW